MICFDILRLFASNVIHKMLNIFEAVDKNYVFQRNKVKKNNFFIKTTSRKHAIHINSLQKKRNIHINNMFRQNSKQTNCQEMKYLNR